MRRAVLAVVFAALVLPGVAAAADVTLEASPATVAAGGVVRFSGTAAVAAGTAVYLYERKGVSWHRVVNGRVHADGRFRVAARVAAPTTYVARVVGGESAPVAVTVRPRLETMLRGAPVVGGTLALDGRLVPARAGTLTVRVDGERHAVRAGAGGRFRVRLDTRRQATLRVRIEVAPADGYAAASRTVRVRIAPPSLAPGSHGPAVRALEERLRALHYLLPGIGSAYGDAVAQAVVAFQKVEGLPSTGRVDARTWRALGRASTPRARVAGGDHIEVSKSRQVLYEVRGGKVVGILHTSTGATGNTPVGRWHIYRKVVGWDWVLWYPMYFLRGFAIHGYPDVPPYPASHGCVRIPMWAAPGIFSRWSTGGTVLVFA